MKISYRAIGRNVRLARQAIGLTQEKTSELLGISLVHYGRLERGNRKISLEQLACIADLLGVSIENLINRMQSPTDSIKYKEETNIGRIVDFLCAGCSNEARGIMLAVCRAIAEFDKFRCA